MAVKGLKGLPGSLGWLKAAPGKAWQGLKNWGKKIFGIGGAATAGGLAGNAAANQQEEDTDQPLNIEEAEPTPNVAPIQQLNMAASGLISPMAPGGSPEEKLDYIAFSVDSMRRSLSTLVSAIRSLAIGQATVNRNVAATAERPRAGVIRSALTAQAKGAGLGALAALGLGGLSALMSAKIDSDKETATTLENMAPAVTEIQNGQVRPEQSSLYRTAENIVTKYDQYHGMPVRFETTIEQAMEEDEEIKTFVEGLKSSGIEVDTKSMLSTLPEIVKQIKPTTQPETAPVQTPPSQQPSTETTIPESSDQTVLENSTASPAIVTPPAAPPTNNDATIVTEPEGETEEDELGIAPQSSLDDQLQTEPENQLLSSTKYIRDRSQEVASNSKAVVAPVVVNNSQAPAQQQMPQISDSRSRGAVLTVAYRTPADSRTYSQDNFASV